MHIHAVMGKSPGLLAKMLFAIEEINKLTLYTNNKKRSKKDLSYIRTEFKLRYPHRIFPYITYIHIPKLDDSSSLSQVFKQMNELCKTQLKVDKNAVLFYSGTIPHLMALMSSLKFSNIMTYTQNFFVITGSQSSHFSAPIFDYHDFLAVHGLSHNHENHEIKKSDNQYPIRIPETLDAIEMNEEGKLLFKWGKVKTSRQRKEFILFVHEIRNVIGAHASKHIVDNPVLINWLKHVDLPFMEEEE
jgi:hypothetical protein